MSNWLHKAMGRDAEDTASPPAVPFEMVCMCGKVLTGQRQTRARRLICTGCGRAQFVLPINQYPESTWKYFGGTVNEEPDTAEATAAAEAAESAARRPRVVPPEEVSAKKVKPESDESEIRVVDDEDEAVPKKGSQERSTPRRKSVRLDALESVSYDRPKSRSKVWMMLAGVSIVVVFLVGISWHRHRRDLAEIRFRQGSDSGHLAFEKRDYGKAREEIDSALDAARILGLNASQTEALRSRRQHLEAIVGLADQDLFDLLGLAPEDVKGKWVILQLPVAVQLVETEKQKFIEWDLVGTKKLVRLRGLDDLAERARSQSLTDVILAAPIEKIESGGDGAFVVHFYKDRAFLWQEVDCLREMGFVVRQDEEANHQFESLIRAQRSNPAPTNATPAASNNEDQR